MDRIKIFMFKTQLVKLLNGGQISYRALVYESQHGQSVIQIIEFWNC